MEKIRGNILWVDDEIEHLKPHILYLEDKGYKINSISNGKDATILAEKNQYDIVLLDQSMPGMDGLETLKELKMINPFFIIIMITKTEDEWLMNEAITEQVEQFLIKPVNPSQIFMACKQALEKLKLRGERLTRDYLKEFREIEEKLNLDLSLEDWWKLYNRLVDWQIKFDEYRDTGMNSILEEQINTCNKEFSYFIEKNYKKWIKLKDRPLFSNDIVKEYINPIINKDEKVCLIVVDCMRYDHFKVLVPFLEPYFNIDIDYILSILPTATAYSRNAIFSGLFPDEIIKKYPKQGHDMKNNISSLNKYESQFLIDQLKRTKNENKSIYYHKIWAVEEGNKFESRFKDYVKKDFISLVVNFVDLLAHKSSQTDVLKEMIQDESGFRSAVKIWFEHSWLLKVLKKLSEENFTVVMTSDHGSTRVQNSVMVSADKAASSGVRYKYGRNLNTNEKNALVIKDPSEYRLPIFGPQPSYIIAKEDFYFVYPNEAHKYQAKFKNSFQHGGISLEEMLIPVAILKSKN